MATFNINWDNSEVVANGNDTSQTVSYRKKGDSVWITSGFTPTNPMATSENSASISGLDPNVVYQFKVEAACDENGPSANDNGIIEQIGFSCFEFDSDVTDTTATVVIDLTNTDITKVRFTLRRSSDNLAVYGPITNIRVGNSVTAVASGLVADTAYYWETVLYATINGVEVNSAMSQYINALCGPIPIETGEAPAPDLAWIADDQVCEKEGGFGTLKTITNLSTPMDTQWDSVTGRMYVLDQDDAAAGNIYWYDPLTATSAGDMNHSSAVHLNEIYNGAIDTVNRKIYMVGKNTGGMLVYDIATDTTSVVAYGTDGTAFNRVLMYVGTTKIYCNNTVTGQIIIIDRTTLTITSTVNISGIPNNTRFSIGGYSIVDVGTELWIVAGTGSSVGTIGVYNYALTSNITNITLTGAAIWVSSGAKFWQSIFVDTTSGQAYVSDVGGNKRYVVDIATRTVLDSRTIINREGKTNGFQFWFVNPINNDLYSYLQMLNNQSDSPLNRVYVEDRDTYAYLNMFEGAAYIRPALVPGTDILVGPFGGLPFWAGGAWHTDGKLTFLQASVGADNTGNVIVTTLQEIDHNNSDLPTGNTKDNLVGDPDYIAPFMDTDECGLPSGTSCPTNKATTFSAGTLTYEVIIPNAVLNNVAVSYFKVFAYNIGTASQEGSPDTVTSPFTTAYKSGTITGLVGTNYTIQVVYYDVDDNVLATC